MAQPAFAAIQTRAEEAALRRLANARLLVGPYAFDCLLAQEVHPMGVFGEMGELRSTIRMPRMDMPDGMARDALIAYDPGSHTVDELMAKKPAQFHVDAIEPYGAIGVKVWLR
ncbi:hypothetical protein [Thiobacillus denitrificans]|uniref:Uncharacterized protein n=1 Tax=Thiobacillus denitrificans TaxID=36861 RepID=A0A119CYA0_THIDE|nr:hypothetical protein [Thiobacillus denitrificans]KVW99512.1 hypothetical protein ABW22_01455 [Thiobacillus denitrificans]